MKILDREHPFTKLLLFAFLAILSNLLTSYFVGFATMYTTTVYVIGLVLLVCFTVMYKKGYEFTAKISSTIFFNAYFFTFSAIYGLKSMAFIYYFPFLISHIYLFRESATKRDTKIFIWTCVASILIIFTVCTMDGWDILTKKQETIMYKRNFFLAFGLSAYYFNAIFSYLMLQMKLAREASASKARFLSIMSHELRTPLNGIISSINLMETTSDLKEKQRFGSVLKSSSEHLLHLVNNVLDYSKASAGKMELNQVPCSMSNLLLTLQEVFQARFDEKQLELEVVVHEEVTKAVLLDDVRFVQVLTNLISNALKFTDRGKVVIAATCKAIHVSTMDVEISVTDTGKGLNKEQQQRIFDSFNNVDKQARNVESSGLGLSISQMIVEMLGGNLLLESQVNKGSKFYFNLSVPLAAVEKKETVAVSYDSISLEGITILIAEDNPINMMVTREFLKRWKVTTLEAVDGSKAQQMIIQNPDIDLLLLDLQMPEMNGYELMEWIQAGQNDFPVLAFTAQIMAASEKADLTAMGFTDMIPKPFAPEELRYKITQAMAQQLTAAS